MNINKLTEGLDRFVERRYDVEPRNLVEALDKVLSRLNEAGMSDEDKRDSDLLRSVRDKIAGKNSNIKNLSPEELDALKRYDLDKWGYKGHTKVVTPGGKDIFRGMSRDAHRGSHADYFYDDEEVKDYWNKDTRKERGTGGGHLSKVNFADRARKLDARVENQPYATTEVMRDTLEREARKRNGIADILYHSRRAQDLNQRADNIEAEIAPRRDALNVRYNNNLDSIDRRMARNMEHTMYHQKEIDDILNKHRRECLEAMESYLRNLDEGKMSDEDRRDSDLIWSAHQKLGRRANAKLTPDELDAMDRHGFMRGYKEVRHKSDNSALSLRQGRARNAYAGGVYPGWGNLDKVNIADYGDKYPERESKRNEISYWGGNPSSLAKERATDAENMKSDVAAMRSALGSRGYYQDVENNLAQSLKDFTIKYETDNFQLDKAVEHDAAFYRNGAKEEEDKKKALLRNKMAEVQARRAARSQNESLTEDNSNERIIQTGLPKDIGASIIDSIIGQLSDGIWENAGYTDAYWPYAGATEDGNISIDQVLSRSGYRKNSFYDMSDSEIAKWFGNKLKQIAQEYLDDNNKNPFTNFRANNDEECSYMHDGITIGQMYDAYNILKSK